MMPEERYAVFMFRLMNRDGALVPENIMLEFDHEPNIIELRTLEKRQTREVYGCLSAAVTGWKRVKFVKEGEDDE